MKHLQKKRKDRKEKKEKALRELLGAARSDVSYEEIMLNKLKEL